MVTQVEHESLSSELQSAIKGDVLTDALSRGIYATDASLYQIEPLAIVLPKDSEDIVEVTRIAREHHVPLIPRGGGTGLAGQTVGRGIVVDFSKYCNRILEINAEEHWVRVQPGIARDALNTKLEPFGLHFAPDPATSSRANVGGMIGNNSSGTKSILYGKTVDHVIELDVLLSDGTQLKLIPHSPVQYDLKCKKQDREGEIYRGVKSLVLDNQKEIEKRFPKVMRRVGGYNMDELTGQEDWNLAKLIVGSEGTLGSILEAKINLEKLPKAKGVCLAHFQDLGESIRAVQRIVKHRPAAVEIIDDTVIRLSRENLTTARSCHVVQGDPAAVLIIEFYDDTHDKIQARAHSLIEELRQAGLGYAFPIHPEGEAYRDVWTIRKKGLGLMLGMKTDKKPIAFIEDAAIPLEHLPDYISEVRAVCDRHT
ncbi:MAG: FAD-binding oxidoreductase, partial [Saprospiraceae bacterium]|nr:FAD-binding oxidoreductase [Saprospiraceae bacterium]